METYRYFIISDDWLKKISSQCYQNNYWQIRFGWKSVRRIPRPSSIRIIAFSVAMIGWREFDLVVLLVDRNKLQVDKFGAKL